MRRGAPSKPGVFRPAEVVACHSFNADGSKVAVCPNDHTIVIYRKNGAAWEKEAVLDEHSQLVTGIDWGHETNRIVSCSQDRNAYVWTLESDGKWKPTLVILRLNRCATGVQWSPKENKFAVSSGAKLVSVCYFEEDNDWWVSKHVKKHRSTVTSVKWHPNNVLIATTSTDYKCRVFSAWTKGVDKRGVQAPFEAEKKKLETFGECLAEFDCGSWALDCDFTPDGNALVFVGQDSSFNSVDMTSLTLATVQLDTLPFRKVIALSPGTAVAAGYDCEPILFSGSGAEWSKTKSLDDKSAGAAQKKVGVAKMWQNMDSKGTKNDTSKLKTKHQNTITWLSKVGDQVVSSGLDGQFHFWKV